MRKRSRVLALILVVLAVAGCSGSSRTRDGVATKARSSASSTTAVTTATAGAATRAEAGAADRAEPASASSPPTTELNIGNGLAIKATLGSACVKPGEKQSITIDIGRQGGVAYNAYYSDGKTGGMENFYGGNNGGRTDEKGIWEDTWVVGPTAPAGPVRVYVVALDESYLRGQATVTFEVAKPTGRCA